MLSRASSNIFRSVSGLSQKRSFAHLNKFATLDPWNMSTADKGQNLVGGEWVGTEQYVDHIDPMTGKPMLSIPNTQMHEIQPFVDSLR